MLENFVNILKTSFSKKYIILPTFTPLFMKVMLYPCVSDLSNEPKKKNHIFIEKEAIFQ